MLLTEEEIHERQVSFIGLLYKRIATSMLLVNNSKHNLLVRLFNVMQINCKTRMEFAEKSTF